MQHNVDTAAPIMAGFESETAASNWRAMHGGWIFIPAETAGAIWFDARQFTPAAIFRHAAARGSGRLI